MVVFEEPDGQRDELEGRTTVVSHLATVCGRTGVRDSLTRVAMGSTSHELNQFN
jgi:hypothetical protein